MMDMFKDFEIYMNKLEKDAGRELPKIRNLVEDWQDTKARLQKTTLSIKAHPDYQIGSNQEFIDIVELNEELL